MTTTSRFCRHLVRREECVVCKPDNQLPVLAESTAALVGASRISMPRAVFMQTVRDLATSAHDNAVLLALRFIRSALECSLADAQLILHYAKHYYWTEPV